MFQSGIQEALSTSKARSYPSLVKREQNSNNNSGNPQGWSWLSHFLSWFFLASDQSVWLVENHIAVQNLYCAQFFATSVLYCTFFVYACCLFEHLHPL